MSERIALRAVELFPCLAGSPGAARALFNESAIEDRLA